jgi:hypothetical protein
MLAEANCLYSRAANFVTAPGASSVLSYTNLKFKRLVAESIFHSAYNEPSQADILIVIIVSTFKSDFHNGGEKHV